MTKSAPRDTLDDLERKFTDQFFASTEGRNDLRREQIQAYITKQVEEARIDELEMAIGMAGKVIIDGFIIDGKLFENNDGDVDVNILKARLEQLRKAK